MKQIDVSAARRPVWLRVSATLAIALVVATSLLCFPHWLPWMIAFWLAWHSIQVLKGKPGYLPLFTGLAICVIRLVPPMPLLITLCGLMLAVACWRYRFGHPSTPRPEPYGKKAKLIGISLLWIAWGGMFWEYRQSSNRTPGQVASLDLSRPIVCIGDSLTQGMIPDRGYPGQLETMVKVPVINQGFSGIATAPAVGIVRRAMELNPQVVVIEVGGHDFLKWHSRSSTKKNLSQMINICRDQGVEVILMEIPRGFMVDPYASLEREIAYEMDVQLVDDRWLRHVVLMSPIAPPGRWLSDSMQLSDDGIHSNEKGSRAIAEFVADALVKLYGKEILR